MTLSAASPHLVSRAEAERAGLKRFFTGIACVNGHVAERYVSGKQCCECQREAFNRYRRENPSKERERRATSYQKNRDRELAYYAANRDRISVQHAAYRRSNPSAIAEQRQASRPARRQWEREWRQKNAVELRERRKAWVIANPEWSKVKKHRRRSRERQAPGQHTIQDLRQLYKLQHGRCAVCFRKLDNKYTIDHHTPLARGGSNDRTNLQLTCGSCNSHKGAKDPIAFAQELGRLL